MSKVTNVPQVDRVAMAEALSYASPGGPVGVLCVDECDCHGAAMKFAAQIYAKVVERGAKDEDAKLMLHLFEAVTVDLIADQRLPLNVDAIVDAEVMVSERGVQATDMRSRYPRTWQVVAASHERK